jgi:hypothetical protein
MTNLHNLRDHATREKVFGVIVGVCQLPMRLHVPNLISTSWVAMQLGSTIVG